MFVSKIQKDNGYNAKGYTYYPVVVIGAGESGIAMGCRLREVLGFDQFRIIDRQSGIGGTWWINRYPGVACDVPAVFYSFSFIQNPNWTAFHPSGPEIVKYLQDVCQKYEIVDKIQLNTDVTECVWNQNEGVWDLKLQHLSVGLGDVASSELERKVQEQGRQAVYLREEIIKAKIVVSAVGGLVEPKKLPAGIPGNDIFQGEIFHSARWKHDVDLKDKDIIVVGTGCSAAQFVPKLAKEYGVKSVTQIMRSPPWVVPGLIPPLGEENWNKWAPWLSKYVPGFQQSMRFLMFAGSEWDWRLFGMGEWNQKERVKLEAKLIDHMKKNVPEKYWEILTPNYGVACKRRILDATWFPGLNDSKIELTTLPLTSIQEKSVILGPTRSYPDPNDTKSQAPNHEVNIPADVIILANGFETLNWIHPMKLVGRDGKTLQQIFDERGGPQLYMGTAMDGFPNFFAIFGPNTVTGHSSVILASENMVNLSLKFIKPILKGDVSEIEIKKDAELAWAEDIQKACKNTVWHMGGCNSWYKADDSDWNPVNYPYSQINFTLRCMFPTYSDWSVKYTRQGLVKKRTKAVFRYVTLALALAGIYHARQHGYSLRDLPSIIRGYLRVGALLGVRALQKIEKKL